MLRTVCFFCFLLTLALGLVAVPPADAQTVTPIDEFFGSDAGGGEGYDPVGLTLGSDRNLYLVNNSGGNAALLNSGTVLKLYLSGDERAVLHSFTDNGTADGGRNADGAKPLAGLVEGADGNFYGTTTLGGSASSGVAYKITPTGVFTTLHNFNDGTVVNDGSYPASALILGTDGSFYGTTVEGGSTAIVGQAYSGNGTVFKMTPAGSVTILHSFSSLSAMSTNGDGATPYSALVQGRDGNFYGTTSTGGASAAGTVYKITSTGTFTTLVSFGGSNGANPLAGLVLGMDGNFYGTTFSGGASDTGTVFKITPTGTLTTLYSFSPVTAIEPYENINGAYPHAPLVLGMDGNFYGTTSGGGTSGSGTIFRITPDGMLTMAYTFSAVDGNGDNYDGKGPETGLISIGNNSFYGTSSLGGDGAGGTVFLFNASATPLTITDLSPALTTAGNPTFSLTIIGTNFTGNTTVTFGGTPVTVTTHTATQLTVTVPAGAIAMPGTAAIVASDPANGTALAAFDVLTPPLTITSLSPTSTAVGGPAFTLTITGTGFTSNSTVTFAGMAVTVTMQTATQLMVTVPASEIAATGAKTVIVSDPANGSASAMFNVFTRLLTIVRLSPGSTTVGGPAFSLIITGTNFTGNTIVTFAGTAVTVTARTATQLTVTVPASAITAQGTKTVVVTDPVDGSASAPFTVGPPLPSWNVQDVAAVADGTARLLWDRSDGAAGIWAMSAGNTQIAVGPTYGPYQGWTAQDITAAGDGTSRILWNRYDGTTGVWAMDAHGNQTSVSPTYGPYSGWKAIDLATAPNGISRLMWRYTNGEAGILTLNPTGGEIIVGRNYGPYTGWTATAVGAAGDGTARMLWTRSDGAMGLWSMDANDLQLSVGPTYGPYSDSHGHWTATDLSTSADGTSQVLWKRGDGAVGVWTFSASNMMTTVGSVYGPYSGFTAAALDAANDKARVLWVRSDRAAGLWSFGSNDIENLIGPVYGPY